MADRLCRSDALPNAASAAVTRQKVFDYALNPDHPIGKEKARHTMSSPTPQSLLMGQQAEAKVFAALAGLPAPWQVFQTAGWCPMASALARPMRWFFIRSTVWSFSKSSPGRSRQQFSIHKLALFSGALDLFTERVLSINSMR